MANTKCPLRVRISVAYQSPRREVDKVSGGSERAGSRCSNFAVQRTTITFESDLRDIEPAAAAARRATELQIPIANATIAQLPSCVFDVFFLDRHDLAASKLLRGNEHDREQLPDHPLSLELLTKRYVQLLGDYVGDSTEPRWSFVNFVEETWDEIAAVEARRAVGLRTG